MSKNIHRIPHYLQASTPEQLKQLMHKNNIKNDQEFLYFDIQREGSFWIAWFWATAPYKIVEIPKIENLPEEKPLPKPRKKKV